MIVWPVTMTTEFGTGGPPLPSMSVAPTNAIVESVTGLASHAARRTAVNMLGLRAKFTRRNRARLPLKPALQVAPDADGCLASESEHSLQDPPHEQRRQDEKQCQFEKCDRQSEEQ